MGKITVETPDGKKLESESYIAFLLKDIGNNKTEVTTVMGNYSTSEMLQCCAEFNKRTIEKLVHIENCDCADCKRDRGIERALNDILKGPGT
jgi:hypothetical protein